MDTKGYRFPKDVILLSVRWYLRYALSYRNLEEMLAERGAGPDHTTVYRWVQRFAPQLSKAFRSRKLAVVDRWRLDETYVKVNVKDRYLYRAVDKNGDTVDFLLTARRNRAAARRFLERAIGNNGRPSLINIDKSGANKAGIDDYNRAHDELPAIETDDPRVQIRAGDELAKDGSVKVRRSVAVNASRVQPNEYDAFRAGVQRGDRALNRRLRFKLP